MVATLSMLSRQGGLGRAKEEAAKTNQARAETVRGAPTFVQMRLLMPYTLGFSFLLRGKPWEWLYDGVRVEDIERAYADPPHSTTEILHPSSTGGRTARARPSCRFPTSRGPSARAGPWSSRAPSASWGSPCSPGCRSGARATRPSSPRGGPPPAPRARGRHLPALRRGERKLTVLLTRWESMRDADEFERSLRGPAKVPYRLGANILVLMGDLGENRDALAIEAVRNLPYWAGH